MKKLLLMTAAVLAAVFLWIALTLPPRRIALTAFDDGSVPGVVHVHTNRSDGQSSPEEVAAAAARAGLKFLVFTDHGDALRTPDPPQYRSGVLCLDGVEISTNGGHYVAIDMPASPYPLGGDARDVVEDVRRLGGFGIAAHPDSPKTQLRWSDWTAPIDGVELVNPDTSWRVLVAQGTLAARRRLLAALLDYPFRSPEVIAGLLQPPAALDLWSAVAAGRRVVTLSGVDAHARLALRSDPDDSRMSLPIPGYESSFRAMSIRARLEKPFSGDASADAPLLMRAIRNGHVYTVVDALAGSPAFEFTASNDLGRVAAGDVLGAGGGVALHVRSNAPAGFTTVVHQGTQTLSSVAGTQDLTVHGPATPGVFWAEIVSNVGEPPVTWIRSNPVYVRGGVAATPATRTRATSQVQSLFDGKGIASWRVEHDPNSVGAVEVADSTSGPELRYRFGLAGGDPVGQFTALVYDLPQGIDAGAQVGLTMRAEKPMRVSVQLRDTAADRWQRSVYVDATSQERSIPLDDFTSIAVTRTPRTDPKALRAIMFVVDTTNTKPGTSARMWIKRVALETLRPDR